MKKQFFDLKDVGQVYFWCLLLPQILAFVFQLILTMIAPKIGSTPEDILQITPVYLSYMMMAQIAFLIVLIFNLRKHDIKNSLKLNFKIGIGNTVICVVIGIVGVFALSPIVGLFDEFLTYIGYSASLNLPFELNSIGMLILLIFLMALVPAILEEFVFRGVVLQGLKRYGKWIAIFATSGLFALIHLSLSQLIFPFLFSIVLCFVVLKTNSILTSIIIHFTANTTSLIVSYCNFNIIFNVPLWAEILIAIGIMIVGAVIVYCLTKLLKNTEKPKTADELLNTLEFDNTNLNYNNNASFFKIAIIVGAILYLLSTLTAFTPITN